MQGGWLSRRAQGPGRSHRVPFNCALGRTTARDLAAPILALRVTQSHGGAWKPIRVHRNAQPNPEIRTRRTHGVGTTFAWFSRGLGSRFLRCVANGPDGTPCGRVEHSGANLLEHRTRQGRFVAETNREMDQANEHCDDDSNNRKSSQPPAAYPVPLGNRRAQSCHGWRGTSFCRIVPAKLGRLAGHR